MTFLGCMRSTFRLEIKTTKRKSRLQHVTRSSSFFSVEKHLKPTRSRHCVVRIPQSKFNILLSKRRSNCMTNLLLIFWDPSTCLSCTLGNIWVLADRRQLGGLFFSNVNWSRRKSIVLRFGARLRLNTARSSFCTVFILYSVYFEFKQQHTTADQTNVLKPKLLTLKVRLISHFQDNAINVL